MQLRWSGVRSPARTMTKDLAMLIGPQQPWMTTQDFLAAIDTNLQKAMAK